MSEATEMKKEPVEMEKPYTFRKLSAEDMFLMFKIIGKIGIKEFRACFEGDTLKGLLASAQRGEDGKIDNNAIMAIGVSVGFEIADLILNNLPKCEKEIYKLLAQVAGMTEDDVKKDAILFTEMVFDFVKKEEFPAFIKVVSRLFK
jgi:hypothetical protein